MDQTVVVCLEADKPTPFDNNVTGPCELCGVAVQWRPNVPEPSIKMCMGCSFAVMNAAEAVGVPVEVAQPPGQREELEKHCGPGAFEVAMKLMDQLREKAKREGGGNATIN